MAYQEEDTIYIIVGDMIRKLRRKADMTQVELAEKLGMMRTSIVNIEAGRQHTTLHTLYMIAAVFQVPVYVFLQEAPSTLEKPEHLNENLQLRLEIIRLREQIAKIHEIVHQNEDKKELQLANKSEATHGTTHLAF